MRPFRIAWVVPVLALASSCSWIGVKPPPQHPPTHGKVDCTESRDGPVADTVGAVLLGSVALSCGIAAAGALLAGGDNPCAQSELASCGLPPSLALMCVLPAAVLAVPYFVSAEYGFRHTKRCQALKRGLPDPSLPARDSARQVRCDSGLRPVNNRCVRSDGVAGAPCEWDAMAQRHTCRADLECRERRCEPAAGSEAGTCRPFLAAPELRCRDGLRCEHGRCVRASASQPTSVPTR